MRLPLLFLLLFSILQADVKTYAYRCDDGFGFVVRFERGVTWLFLPGLDEPLLFIHKGGKGTVYRNDHALLELNGQKASLQLNDEHHKGCRNDRRRALWEDAKLRGVDFRAIGNEPPWILEITGNRLELFMGYDKVRHLFKATPQVNAKARETRYHAKEKGHTLEVVLRPGPCADSMADESYETRVTLVLDGRTWRGCGQALH